MKANVTQYQVDSDQFYHARNVKRGSLIFLKIRPKFFFFLDSRFGAGIFRQRKWLALEDTCCLSKGRQGQSKSKESTPYQELTGC
jgi:hypothetical protein